MRELTLFMHMSLDGYVAAADKSSGLTTAESNQVSAMAAYEKARVELGRSTGLLLDHTGVVLADAQRGQVIHMPVVPGVTPRQDLGPGTAPKAPSTQPQGD